MAEGSTMEVWNRHSGESRNPEQQPFSWCTASLDPGLRRGDGGV